MKMIKASRHYLMILAIMLVVVSLSDTTYSLFFKADSTANFTYSTGLLDLQIIEGEQIGIESTFPMIDSDGMKSTPYVLTIKNTGSLPYLFDLKMLSESDNNSINTKYIKVQVDDYSASTLYLNNNEIVSDVILYPDEEVSFSIRVWLDINTPNTELGKSFVAKIVTSGQAIYKTLDSSGANKPKLDNDMLPVYYDDDVDGWRIADKNNILDSYEWYNYDNQKWANVVVINDSEKQIYDITRNNNLSISETRNNNGNYVSDMEYLDLNLNNFSENSFSGIFRVKFNDIDDDKIFIISNDIMSYYYDVRNSKFVFMVGNSYVESTSFAIDKDIWYILGFTYNKNSVSFYINGNNIGSRNVYGSIFSNVSLKMATDSSFNVISNLEIGDIYLYNDILTDYEISDNYRDVVNIIYDNLIAGYNDFEPKTLKDFYSNQNYGSLISYDDISLHYVWIPRFKYKLWNVTGASGIDSYNAYENGIEIIFENQLESSGTVYCNNNQCYSDSLFISMVTKNDNNKFYTHPAFKVDGEDISGFWVSKYEISTESSICNLNVISGCLSDSLVIKSKYGNIAWRNNSLLNFYTSVKKLGNNYNIIKNTDWGALVYLTYSKFGLCSNDSCKLIGTNKTFISGSEVSDSSTYNNYGVYDLSGGVSEFVMGSYSSLSNSLLSYGVNDYDSYLDDTFILGDATREISLSNGIWYNNYNMFIDSTNNWFIRGGIGPTDDNGIVYYNATTEMNNEYIGTRIVIK